MKIALITLTNKAESTAQKIAKLLPGECTLYTHSKNDDLKVKQNQFLHLRDIMPDLWRKHPVLIFIMATGIVVRQIAPFIERKDKDPAVIVLDEEGRFVISLLSGHLGGANAWSRYLADGLKATAVITTATDSRGIIAPDEYARRFGWSVTPLANLPTLNSRLLGQGHVKVWSKHPFQDEHPLRKDLNYLFLDESSKENADLIISAFPDNAENTKVYLIPKILSVGIGCRRGTGTEEIFQALQTALKNIGASLNAVQGLYSIDKKADEEGLIEAAAKLRIPFLTFSAQQIQTVNEMEQLTKSQFVKKEIGVDGVCEAASLLGTKDGTLILPKQKFKGITIAISQERFLSWEWGREILNI